MAPAFADFGRALARRRSGHTVDERRSDLDGFDLEIRAEYPDWFNRT